MFHKYERSGLMLMALPLYAGPVLAGWMHAQIALPGALAAMIFLAQLMAGKTAERGTVPMTIYLGLLAAVQVAVVTAGYLLGLLPALVTGPLVLPLWLPLALTGIGASILVRRYRHDPQEAEMLEAMDQAIQSIETGTTFEDGTEPPQEPEVDAAVSEALEALWDLPEDVSYAELDHIVQRLETRVGARGFYGLLAEIDEGFPQVDRAMLRYLAAPPVRAALVDSGDIGFALELLVTSDHPATLGELGKIILTLLDENAPLDQLPDTDDLRQKPELALEADLVRRARQDQPG